MTVPLSAARRQPGGRIHRLALVALAITGLAGASAPRHSAGAQGLPQDLVVAPPAPLATTVPRASASTTAPPAQAGAACRVYPIAIDQRILETDPTTGGPGPVPMPDPSAPSPEIPRASRFHMRFTTTLPQGLFLTWTGDQTTAALRTALTGGGTLGAGFSEAAPPASDPGAGRLVNGVLETGDWLRTMPGVPQGDGLGEALSAQIDQNTVLTVPVFDALQATNDQRIVRVTRFVRVRLLGFTLTDNGWLQWGLVSDAAPYACFQYQTPIVVGQTAMITPSMPLSGTLERRWDFGDGSPASTALTPTHAYAQPGTYTVTLTLPYTPTLQAVGRIEVQRPVLPPQVFLPLTFRRSAP